MTGRIPVVVDNDQSPPFSVLETSAQLLYLLKFDVEHRFSFADPLEQSELIQWLFFFHGGGAPYQGNLTFFRKAQEQSPCKCSLDRPLVKIAWKLIYSCYAVAINRFRTEFYRVLGVLEIQLSGKYTGVPRDYLAGKGKGQYSVADMGTWAWVKNWTASDYTSEEMSAFPHLLRWIARVAERPAVQRGIGDKYKLP